jgi:hypothetical protein
MNLEELATKITNEILFGRGEIDKENVDYEIMDNDISRKELKHKVVDKINHMCAQIPSVEDFDIDYYKSEVSNWLA